MQDNKNEQVETMAEGFGETVPGNGKSIEISKVEIDESEACSGVYTQVLGGGETDAESFFHIPFYEWI